VREIRQLARENSRLPGQGPEDSLKSSSFRLSPPGTRPALCVFVVNPFRARLSAIAIVAAMLLAGAAPLFASEAAQACAAHHHDCTKAVQLKGCCCIEQGDRSNEATPATGKTQIAQPVANATAVVTSAPLALPALLHRSCALTTKPCSSPPDLITLFGTFLI